MLYFLLILIAVGVLLLSEPGKQLLAFIISSGITLVVLGVIIIALSFGYFYVRDNFGKKEAVNDIAVSVQKPETSADVFPMNKVECNQTSCEQYAWYDRHNVPMASRCYPGGCTVEQWALAVYADPKDKRGNKLKELADKVFATQKSKFSTEKCVTENGIKICDLKYSSSPLSGISYRDLKLEGNKATCIDMTTGSFITNNIDSIRASSNPSYCASDVGYVYIDPTLIVNKYWGQIKRKGDTSPYLLEKSYDTCIWTWADGSGAIPYIDVLGNVGPRSGFDVKAFCKAGNNKVDIYTFSN